METWLISEDCEERIHERLIAEQLLAFLKVNFDRISYGDDSDGVPDIFVFRNNKLIYTIEVTGYIFSKIQDLRPNKLVGNVIHIDVESKSRIHDQQENPYTVIEKKIKGQKKYKRFQDESLILLIHSDVRIENNKLVFPDTPPFGITPSCNYFSHNRDEIIKTIKNEVDKLSTCQWVQIWLIDYTLQIDTNRSIKTRFK